MLALQMRADLNNQQAEMLAMMQDVVVCEQPSAQEVTAVEAPLPPMYSYRCYRYYGRYRLHSRKALQATAGVTKSEAIRTQAVKYV